MKRFRQSGLVYICAITFALNKKRKKERLRQSTQKIYTIDAEMNHESR
jgi:cbb3-type cytochrome oxidase subunit 3